MNVLFISYDGMTDPLGQSQVIPYLQGLSKQGHKIHLLSCEKKANFSLHRDKIQSLLLYSKITWHPIEYTKNPPILSTYYDIKRLQKKSSDLHRELNFDIVHCRSYIAAMVGQRLKAKFAIKFLFDIRGFWADERVDGGLWDLSKTTYRLVYNYFKRKEKSLFSDADGIVTLTKASKDFILDSFKPQASIKVIPCAADLNLFVKQTQEVKTSCRKSLGLESEHVLMYLGSLGTWYMLPEMLDFFKVLKQVKPDSKFVFITADEPASIESLAREKGIDDKDIIVKRADRNEVPAYISITDMAIFFIKPCFSKMASSPTKHGELLSGGIPVVCNDIGDLKEIVDGDSSGVVIDDFTDAFYKKAIDAYQVGFDEDHLRSVAAKYYSLEKGISSYSKVYEEFK